MVVRDVLFKRVLKKGFTLVELLVSISIMSMILGITLSGGPQATMRLTLGNNVYHTELMIREAQLQGSAINSLDDAYGGSGIYFNRATSSTVLKFKDKVDTTIKRAIGIGDGLYREPPVDKIETSFNFSNNHKIGKLCVATSTSPLMCNDAYPAVIDVKTLTVSFNRPKQTAHLYANDATITDYTLACVQIDSVKSPAPGFVKSIYVYRSGMIVKTSDICQ